MKSKVRVVCPRCKGNLEELDTLTILCQSCGLQYRTVFSIPDLRHSVGEELENDSDRMLAEQLIAAYPKYQYFDLVDLFFSSIKASNLPKNLVVRYRNYHSHQLSRGNQLANMFLIRLKEYYDLPDYTWALELGCGSGAGLVTLSEHYTNVIGVDPSLPRLILARKFCDENNIRNVHLVQAYGQQLPFLDNSFSYVTAQNVLEHVFDIDDVLAEVTRVLRPSGGFVADSRNRYDLFFPEPHVQLRGVGLLPRAWANLYVQWRLGISYEAFHTRLLSYGDLRKALRRSFGNQYQIVIPSVTAYDMSKKWDTLLVSLEQFEWLYHWLVIISPTHLALAQKK